MIRKWKAFHENLIFMQTEKTVPEVMNDLVEIFCRLVEWDKNMHIAALEGKDVQDLIDISEEILEHPMIAFDASFDVLAYTRHTGVLHGITRFFRKQWRRDIRMRIPWNN